MPHETLKTALASHGIPMNEAHAAIVGKLGDGTILKNLLALVEKYGPQIAAEVPAIMADIASGNYLGAMTLLFAALAAEKPAA